jgi:hypothetical protein
MKRLRDICLAVSFAVCLLLPYHSVAQQKEEGVQVRLGMEILRSGAPKFYLPVSSQSYAVVRVPITEDVTGQEGKAAAVKVAAQMEGNSVRINVSAFFGEIGRITSCDQLNNLKEQFVASYLVRKGESVQVPELTKLGARFGAEPLRIAIVKAKAMPNATTQQAGAAPSPPAEASRFSAATKLTPNPQGTGCLCGGCGDLSCCPTRGHCLTCGDCGMVCCGIGGN